MIASDSVGNGCRGWDFAFGKSIHISDATCPWLEFRGAMKKCAGDGPRCLYMAKVVIALEEVVGAIPDFVVFEVGLLNGIVAAANDINPATGLSPKDVVDISIRRRQLIEIERLQDIGYFLNFGPKHADLCG